MHLILTAILTGLLSTGFMCYAWAVRDTDSFMSADQLGQVLNDLKTSAQRLNEGNTALTFKIAEARQKIDRLKLKYAQIEQQNNELTKASLKFQDVNASRTKKITELEKKLFDYGSRMEQLALQKKEDEDLLSRSKPEEDRLDARLAELGIVHDSIQPNTSSATGADSEKMQLLTQIQESHHKQQQLLEQIGKGYQGELPTVVSVQVSGEKERLMKEIRLLEEEISQLTKVNEQPGIADGVWGPEQIRQMESQVKVLQDNHDELEVLVAQMQDKTARAGYGTDQLSEELRLKNTLEVMQREYQRLLADQSDFQQQLVELDKRKTHLEVLLRK